MPNLIELRLKGQNLKELKLQKSTVIRYLTLPFNSYEYKNDFVNVIKNTPHLIQFSEDVNF